MGNHDEEFEDVAKELQGLGGIFQGDGQAALERVTSRIVPTGYSYNLQCQRCGGQIRAEVGWDEFITIVNNMSPRGWTYDPGRGGVYPPGNCRCGGAVPLLITKQDASNAVNAGVNKGYLDPRYVANASKQLQAAAAAAGRR